MHLAASTRGIMALVLLACTLQVVAAAAVNVTDNGPQLGDAPLLGATDVSLSWRGIVTGFLCIILLLVLSFDLLSCHVAMFCLTLVLQLCGIITTNDALAGLMNSSVISVQLLVVLTAPVAKLPLVKLLIKRLLNSTSIDDLSRRRWVIAIMNLKICLIAYSMSWFVGNIPTTVILTPLIHQYCIEHDIPSSQLLMSIQIAGLVGGTFSKIGVSTTMLVSGLMEQHGLPPMPFFETIKVSGIPAIFALVYMTIAPHYLLPRETKGIVQQLVTSSSKSFLGDFLILPTSYLVGRTIEALRGELVDHHVDVISASVAEGSAMLTPPPDDLVLAAGNRLTLTGEPKALEGVTQWLHLEWQQEVATDGDFASDTMRGTFRGTFRGSVASPGIAARLSTRLSQTQNRSFFQGNHTGRAVSRAVMDDDVSPTDESPSVLAEVVLSESAGVVGRSVGRLRTVYHLALLGLRRSGENYSPSQVMAKLNTYHSGDTLLVVGPLALIQKYDRRGDFLLVTMLDDTPALSKDDGVSYVAVPMKFPFGRLMLEDGFGRILSTGSSAATSTSTNTVEKRRNEGSPLLEHELVPSPTAQSAGDLLPAAVAEPPVPPAVAVRRYRKVIVVPKWYAYMTLLVLAAAIGASIGGQELVVCCQVAVVAVLAFRLRRMEDVVKALKFEVYIVMAFSFGLGTAMTKSGLSGWVASKIASANISGWTLQFVISLTASMMSNVISSKAAAQVLMPVVLDIAVARGDDPMGSLVNLSVSIVQSLITPYSHASGLVVQGPGGYTAVDFYKIGTPLNIVLCMLVATTAVSFY